METRRSFLKKAALLSGGAGLAGALPASIAQALAINPAAGSTWLDAGHIVFLMQENRSFDHTYGTLQGVRGFNDPRAITLPDNNKVWLQTNAAGETYAPFHLDMRNTKATWMNSLPHSWSNQVDARNNGKYDRWLQAKASGNKAYRDMPLTMGYHNREDIPFYYALADAFTVCDQHFCSSLTGTTPNRLYFWTGTIREKADPHVLARVWNGDADYGNWANWTTFPERLEDLGVSWKVYQNEVSVDVGFEGEEASWLSNFTDNPLEFFSQYQVKLSAAYIANLPKAAQKLAGEIARQEEQLKTLATGSAEAVRIGKRIERLKQQLAIVEEDRQIYTREKYEQLSQREKNLHDKAFTTNRKDPYYHQLETLTYKDGAMERTVQLPKGDILHQFREDVNTGQLPTVSWIVAPENFSDHPEAAWYGAWYISEVMDILTRNPEVWKKTILVLTYDENDGYFDHVPPFVAPHPHNKATGAVTEGIQTDLEYVTASQQSSSANDMRESPIGLGYRVPLVVVSPWSRGGWVNSQVFDHTSSLQMLEKFLSHKLGRAVTEPNITAWRRAVCGDLTSVFRPYNGENITIPAPVERNSFIEGIHKAQFKQLPSNYGKLSKEAIQQANTRPSSTSFMPVQEKGIRDANALPYELYVNGVLSTDKQSFTITFEAGNTVFGDKAAGAPFQVYAPGLYKGEKVHVWDFTVAAGKTITANWPLQDFDDGCYHLQVYGPNGFFREFIGGSEAPPLSIRAQYEAAGKGAALLSNRLLVTCTNGATTPQTIVITDNAYQQPVQSIVMPSRKERVIAINTSRCYGWYDFTVTVKGHNGFSKRYAGRIETGAPGKTDPQMGGVLKRGSE